MTTASPTTLGPCLDEGQIAELVAGALDPQALAAAERHLDACEACRALIGAVASHEREAKRPPVPTRGTEVGRFIIVAEVGRGGAGQVFSAYDGTLDRRVAIKLLRPEVSSEARQRRLEVEARALARLTHPNVITLYDAGRWNGQAYLCMEFVSGGTARDWVSARPRPWRDVVRLFIGAGRGLAAAHAVGLVHRDIKPENVLVRPDGTAVVTDFGLATEAPLELEPDARLSSIGKSVEGFVGTPAYMAPAQLRGGRGDAASDQFSFCVSLYELLFGARPFEATTAGALTDAIEAQAITWPSHAPRRLRRVLERGLRADPSRRFPSMNALLDELERTTRGVVGVSAVSALTVGVAVVLSLRSACGAPSPCDAADARLVSVWAPAREEAVQRAFLATKAPDAEKAVSRLSSTVHERVAVLRSTRAEACRLVESGRDVGGFWSRRVSCLDERVAELDVLLVGLEVSDPALVAVGVELVDRLPSVRACRADSSAEPATPAEQARRERLVSAATTAGTFLALGRPKDAKARLDAESDAEASDEPSVPVFSLQRALVVQALEGPSAAEPALVAAALAAVRVGEPFVAATGYLELAQASTQRLQLSSARAWLEHARHHAERAGDPVLDLRLEAARAELDSRAARAREAVATLSKAIGHFERAVGLRADVVRLKNALAFALKESGQPDAALASIDDTVRASTATLGARDLNTLDAVALKALILEDLGRADEAIETLTAVLERAGPSSPLNAARTLKWSNNLASILNGRGRHLEAEAVMDAVLPAWDDAFGPESMGAPIVLETLGTAKLGVGKRDEALVAADRGLSLCRVAHCQPKPHGELHFLRARALLASGRQEEALDAAVQAEALYRSAGEAGRVRLSRLEAWLPRARTPR